MSLVSSLPCTDPRGHCFHRWSGTYHLGECQPCCRCGDDTPDVECDCPRCRARTGRF